MTEDDRRLYRRIRRKMAGVMRPEPGATLRFELTYGELARLSTALMRATPSKQIATSDRMVAAVTALAEAGIGPDIQELLVQGNPDDGVPPGALARALDAAERTRKDGE